MLRILIFAAIHEAFKGNISMSKSNGVEPNRLRQLRAIAENLCTLANRHRENHNYGVAHALYGHALSAAQEIDTPGNDGNSLVKVAEDDTLWAVDDELTPSPLIVFDPRLAVRPTYGDSRTNLSASGTSTENFCVRSVLRFS